MPQGVMKPSVDPQAPLAEKESALVSPVAPPDAIPPS